MGVTGLGYQGGGPTSYFTSPNYDLFHQLFSIGFSSFQITATNKITHFGVQRFLFGFCCCLFVFWRCTHAKFSALCWIRNVLSLDAGGDDKMPRAGRPGTSKACAATMQARQNVTMERLEVIVVAGVRLEQSEQIVKSAKRHRLGGTLVEHAWCLFPSACRPPDA
jgi:hypothetical protein